MPSNKQKTGYEHKSYQKIYKATILKSALEYSNKTYYLQLGIVDKFVDNIYFGI